MFLGLFFKKDLKKLPDADLLELVRQQDNRALGVLFERYGFLVMGLCLKYLKDRMAAEDLMMQIFERLPEKIQRSGISHFKSWLYSVSRNECLMLLRKKNPRTADESMLLFEADTAEESLKLALLKEDKLRKLETALQELKDEQKTCLVHFYLERRSYEEVAALTGFDLNKVKSYIQNGKRNLKMILEQHREFRS